MYEIIRTIYATPTAETADAGRVPVLQQTLSQLRLTNIATLDACMNHFTRLIDLTSADEEYVAQLATSLSPCILRPRVQTSMTMEEKHAYRLIRDLFAHKDAIFSELKRMSTTLGASPSVSGSANRPRAISTDESNRKAHMEERTRALLEKSSAAAGGGGVANSRSRATSPAPSPARGSHRRDRSIGGPESRFPIQPSAAAAAAVGAGGVTSPTTTRGGEGVKRTSLGPVLPKRTSLEVPDEMGVGGGMGLSHPADGHFGGPLVSHPEPLTMAKKVEAEAAMLEKRNSLSRSGARFVGGRRVAPGPTGLSAERSAGSENATPGVTLTDAPMDY